MLEGSGTSLYLNVKKCVSPSGSHTITGLSGPSPSARQIRARTLVEICCSEDLKLYCIVITEETGMAHCFRSIIFLYFLSCAQLNEQPPTIKDG